MRAKIYPNSNSNSSSSSSREILKWLLNNGRWLRLRSKLLRQDLDSQVRDPDRAHLDRVVSWALVLADLQVPVLRQALVRRVLVHDPLVVLEDQACPVDRVVRLDREDPVDLGHLDSQVVREVHRVVIRG